jgi:hypothetical protein
MTRPAEIADMIALGEETFGSVDVLILRAITAHHPNSIDNETTAGDANYSASSTSYVNPRGALKSKDLISYPASGAVRAADWLFAA